LDESFAKHIIKKFSKETELCAREQVDVAMRGIWSFLKVNFIVKLVMRRHFLSLFS